MPRMNSRQRAKAYLLCKERDGEQCADCKRIPVKVVKNPLREVKKLVVDHLDNHPDNNPADGSNWALRCHSCNIKKNPRGAGRPREKFASFKHLKLYHAQERAQDQPIVRYAEMLKNLEAEEEFRRFVEKTVLPHSEVEKSLLLDAAAENHRKSTGKNISQQTLSRYLAKMTNEINGDYEELRLDDKWVIRLKNRNNNSGGPQ